MERKPGVILALLACGWLAGAAAPLGASVRNETAIDAPVEAAILEQDWQTVDRLLGSQPQLPPEARLVRGHALLALNRNTESLCLFQSASSEADTLAWLNWTEAFAARRPESVIAHYLRGDALARSERWADAGSAFEAALGLSPNHPLALDALGVTQAIRGQFDQALVSFLKATRSAPGLADAHASLGSLWIQWRRGAKGSVASFDRALRIAPEFALALYSRGAVEALLGRFDEARQDLDQGLAKSGCMKGTLAAGVTELVGRMTAEEEIRLALADGAAPGMVMERYTKEIQRNGPGQIGGPLSKLLTLSSLHPEMQDQVLGRLSQMSRSDPLLGEQIQAGLSRIQAFGSQMGPLAARASSLQQPSPAGAWINPRFSGTASPALPGGPLFSPLFQTQQQSRPRFALSSDAWRKAANGFDDFSRVADMAGLPLYSKGYIPVLAAAIRDAADLRDGIRRPWFMSNLSEAGARFALDAVGKVASHWYPWTGFVTAGAGDIAKGLGGWMGTGGRLPTGENADLLTKGVTRTLWYSGGFAIGFGAVHGLTALFPPAAPATVPLSYAVGGLVGGFAAAVSVPVTDAVHTWTQPAFNAFAAWAFNFDTRRNLVRSYDQLTKSWDARGMPRETFSQVFGRDNLKGVGFSDQYINRMDAGVAQSPSKFSVLSIPPQDFSNALKLGAADQLRRMAGFPLPPGCGVPGARCGGAGVESLSGLAGKTLQQLPAPTLPGGFKTSLEEVVWVGDNWPLQARYGLGYRMPPQTAPKLERGGTNENR